jgi:hypothetical protein
MLRQFIQLRRFNASQHELADEIVVRITERIRESVNVTVKGVSRLNRCFRVTRGPRGVDVDALSFGRDVDLSRRSVASICRVDLSRLIVGRCAGDLGCGLMRIQ